MRRSLFICLVVLSGFLAGCGQVSGKAAKLLASPTDGLYEKAKSMMAEGKVVDGQTALQQIITEHPDFKEIEQVEQDLYTLNMKLLFSDIPGPQTVVHEVDIGDTLGKICRKYNVTMDLVKASNGLGSDVVRIGQRLRVWTGKFSIVVNKTQNTLMLKSDEDIFKIYSVSTGANGSTPVGTFKITNKIENPVWYKQNAIIPPESPDNALGSRWMGLDKQGYGIHGTVQPDKIGQQITAGCVRMRNSDVEELYKIVPVGTQVLIQE